MKTSDLIRRVLEHRGPAVVVDAIRRNPRRTLLGVRLAGATFGLGVAYTAQRHVGHLEARLGHLEREVRGLQRRERDRTNALAARGAAFLFTPAAAQGRTGKTATIGCDCDICRATR